MKVFAVLGLFLACLVPCYASSTQTWDVTASCNPAFYIQTPCATPANISAVFTTTLESGSFYSDEGHYTFTGQEPVVTDITGTFNGSAMTLLNLGNGGDWMSGNMPQDVTFMAGGSQYDLFLEYSFFGPVAQGVDGSFDYLNWSASDPVGVPEPATILLLTLALAITGLLRPALRRPLR